MAAGRMDYSDRLEWSHTSHLMAQIYAVAAMFSKHARQLNAKDFNPYLQKPRQAHHADDPRVGLRQLRDALEGKR